MIIYFAEKITNRIFILLIVCLVIAGTVYDLIIEYLKERKQAKRLSYQSINNEEEENKESEALIKKVDKKSND